MLTTPSPVSTGQLPQAQLVRTLVAEAHERFKSNNEGKNADYIPALAKAPSDLFGVCVVSASGVVYAAGDTDYDLSRACPNRSCSPWFAKPWAKTRLARSLA
jgi:hypothetical protein